MLKWYLKKRDERQAAYLAALQCEQQAAAAKMLKEFDHYQQMADRCN